MGVQNAKRRRVEDEVRRPKKKIRHIKKQKHYHSSSEDEDEPEERAAIISTSSMSNGTIDRSKSHNEHQPRSASKHKPEKQTEIVTSLVEDQMDQEDEDSDDAAEEEEEEAPNELEVNTALNMNPGADSEDELDAESLGDVEDDEPELDDEDEGNEDSELDADNDDFLDDSETESTNPNKTVKKRNDPNAFATSISKILTTKLTTQKRSDPILSRSKTADEATKAIADTKLDSKARASIRAERRSLLEKGRVRDVLGLETTGVDTGAILEEEKRLKKTAQRGVIKLFNAVRAAQVKAEQGERQQKEQNVVGMQKREERVNELSKEGFLDLLSRGGKSDAVEA